MPRCKGGRVFSIFRTPSRFFVLRWLHTQTGPDILPTALRRSGVSLALCLTFLLGLAPDAGAEPTEATPTPGASLIPEGAANATPDVTADREASRVPGWNAVVRDLPGTPPRMVVVDKSVQRLHLYERRSPLTLKETFTCTTGQRTGDKLVSGDRRTPEGIYFVTTKIDNGLDFQEYGGVAHTLNYPNPVDRLRGKTGYGIWIHSKGRPISPLETKGCIAVNLDDIKRLGEDLPLGTAVVVADSVRSEGAGSGTDSAISRILEKKTRDWNAAWAGRSSGMFDFYMPAAYSKAQGESFQAFRAQKERLFSSLAWIQIIHGPVYILQGPDYWVSWFMQYYRAPNLSTEGIRRLYWQPDAGGELRIVGMEWLPMDLGMETAYLETVTPSAAAFIERWRAAWLAGDVDAYMACYAPNATQGGRKGVAAIAQHKRATWTQKKPAKVDLSGLRVMVVPGGVKVDMMQTYRDTSGYQDKGVKTVMLHPQGEGWLIASEDWSAVPK